ncbi:MAG TPA: nitroreductase family protein [Dehalococcoidales bacterium]|nr:MAG: hypothetical protein A2Z05_05885 [Chloroflexi bacterium RBG_16_60_22]HJX13720.1 nitroreductase family protein [Dehalococcoidales bacterium]
MALIEVDKQTCTRCGACAAVCPGGFFIFRKGRYPRPIPAIQEFCLRCGHCVAVCPADSLDHREIPLAQCPPIEPSLKVTFEQFAQLARSRRSIRAYKDKKVPREEITRLIDVARGAPTGHNAQTVRWLVFDDRGEISRLSEIGADWMRWSVENKKGMVQFLEGVLKRQETGYDEFLRSAPAIVVAYAEKGNPIAFYDCVIALTYLELAAGTAGLGCCWAGLLQSAATGFPPMMEVLAIPEGHVPCGCMMLGYPRYGYRRSPRRQPARIAWRP